MNLTTILLSPAPAAASPASTAATSGASAGASAGAAATTGNAAAGLASAVVGALGPGARVEGVIAGRDPWGRPLLTTARGTFSVAGLPAAAAIGSRVVFETRRSNGRLETVLVSLTPPVRDTGSPASRPAPLSLADRWVGLEHVLKALDAPLGGRPSDASARTPLDALMSKALAGSPLIAGSFVARLIGTIAALRSGDLARLIGRASLDRLTASGKGALRERLESDLDALEISPKGPGGWRGLFVPILDDGAVRMLRLFARSDEDGDGDTSGGGGGSRFVIETELTRLGALQIDGLVSGRNVDVIVRTHQQLPADWRDDMHTLFTDALTLTGVTGRLAFQSELPFPVTPLAELKGRGSQPELFA